MRAKLGESMPNEAAAVIRGAGWDCDTVHDEGLSGTTDTRIAEVCRAESRVLFTLDLDFSDIRAYPPADYAGIIVLRPPDPGRDSVLRLLARVLPVLAREWKDQQLWIIEPSRIRARSTEHAAE